MILDKNLDQFIELLYNLVHTLHLKNLSQWNEKLFQGGKVAIKNLNIRGSFQNPASQDYIIYVQIYITILFIIYPA